MRLGKGPVIQPLWGLQLSPFAVLFGCMAATFFCFFPQFSLHIKKNPQRLGQPLYKRTQPPFKQATALI